MFPPRRCWAWTCLPDPSYLLEAGGSAGIFLHSRYEDTSGLPSCQAAQLPWTARAHVGPVKPRLRDTRIREATCGQSASATGQLGRSGRDDSWSAIASRRGALRSTRVGGSSTPVIKLEQEPPRGHAPDVERFPAWRRGSCCCSATRRTRRRQRRQRSSGPGAAVRAIFEDGRAGSWSPPSPPHLPPQCRELAARHGRRLALAAASCATRSAPPGELGHLQVPPGLVAGGTRVTIRVSYCSPRQPGEPLSALSRFAADVIRRQRP